MQVSPRGSSPGARLGKGKVRGTRASQQHSRLASAVRGVILGGFNPFRCLCESAEEVRTGCAAEPSLSPAPCKRRCHQLRSIPSQLCSLPFLVPGTPVLLWDISRRRGSLHPAFSNGAEQVQTTLKSTLFFFLFYFFFLTLNPSASAWMPSPSCAGISFAKETVPSWG